MKTLHKKIYLIVFGIVLLAGSATFALSSILRANAEPYWTDANVYATSYDGGSGSPSDPYKIGSAAQLARMAYQVNNGTNNTASFVLDDNVDLTGNLWTPIGSSNKAFSGKFDGKGYAISGLKITTATSYAGLFGYATNATISNVIVEGLIRFDGSKEKIGGVLGAGSNVQFSKVSNNVEIYTAASSSVGGLVGQLNNSSSTITESFNNSNVNGKESVSGLVGYSSDSIQVTNSYNNGNVNGERLVAGIIGYSYSAIITNVYNYGNIMATKEYAAGIATHGAAIDYVQNYGNVTSNGNYVAGIMCSPFTPNKMNGAVNSGNIKGNNQVGGILSFFIELPFKIYMSSNFGTVQGNDYVGGIVGGGPTYKGHERILSGCGNFGTVKGASYVGGIFGGSEIRKALSSGENSIVQIFSCFNQASVEASGDYVGGIAGALTGKRVETTETYWEWFQWKTRTVVSYENGAAQIGTCYNTGTINGKNYRGGIVGYINAENTDIPAYVINSFNLGTITSNSSKVYVGALVGRNQYDNAMVAESGFLAGKSSPDKALGTGDEKGTNYKDKTYSYTSAQIASAVVSGLGVVFIARDDWSVYPAFGKFSRLMSIYEVNEIDSRFSADIWQRTSTINNGNPYLKNFYW